MPSIEAGRDTGGFYLDGKRRVAAGHLDLALRHGGQRIHDAAAATGDYVEALLASGRDCTGSDLNQDYVDVAVGRGLPVQLSDARSLPLEDKSVDSVLLYEVLEHIAEKDVRRAVLREARRVARRAVLITTPNSTHRALLEGLGLTYEHMLDRDHKVFFDEVSLRADLDTVFDEYDLQETEDVAERIAPLLVRGLQRPWVYRFYPRLLRTRLYYRFYVVARP